MTFTTSGTKNPLRAAQVAIAKNENAITKSLERIASGFKINRPSDDPTNFLISESIRSQVRGIEQVIENTEIGIGLLQLADGALSQIEDSLRVISQNAIRAANTATITAEEAALYQLDLEQALNSIDSIAKKTKFGNKSILDGEAAFHGKAVGTGIEVVSLNGETKADDGTGYDVLISRTPQKAKLVGEASLNPKKIKINEPEIFRFEKDGFILDYQVNRLRALQETVDEINAAFEENEMGLEIGLAKGSNLFVIESTEFGSDQTFRASSSTEGLFGNDSDSFQAAKPGRDVAGTINGERAFGQGTILTAAEDNPQTAGLKLSYTYIQQYPVDANGNIIPNSFALPRKALAGKVFVTQNALRFQIGENADENVVLNLKNVKSEELGRKIENVSGFESLRDVDISTFDQARDTIPIANQALKEIIQLRAEVGAMQRFSLENNLKHASVARENLIAANSTITDANLAEEVSNLTLHQVKLDTAAAVFAQANQMQENILKLIKSDE